VDIDQLLDALTNEGQRLAAAAAVAGPEAEVPRCPGWVVRDLVRHLGGVHRWATSIVDGPRAEPWRVDLDEVVGSRPADDDLLGWFTQGHARLVEVLATSDPDLDCWTFLAAPSPLAMWARRQAHETAIHRVDAELAAGWPVTPLPQAFAADGIGELLTCFITRPGGQLRVWSASSAARPINARAGPAATPSSKSTLAPAPLPEVRRPSSRCPVLILARPCL
jgi:uncharacterized protein (TIGR03083 family)